MKQLRKFLLKNRIAPKWAVFGLDMLIACFAIVYANYLRFNFDFDLITKNDLIDDLVIVIVTNSVLFYIFKTYRAFFNSDAAIANILAEEIVYAGTFFPTHWWYVNNDLWVFYKQILVIPWVLLGKNGYFAHAFAVFFVTLFMVVFLYAFLRSLMFSRTASLMGGVVVCVGYSPMYLRELYGEAAYTWYFLFMIAFMFIFRKISWVIKFITYKF